jgi:hypothetical protein
MKKLACVLLLICGCSSRAFVSSEPGAVGHADAAPGAAVDASSAADGDAATDAAIVAPAGQDASDSGHGLSADSGAVGNGGATGTADSGAADAGASDSLDAAATVADGGTDSPDAQQPFDAGACNSVIARTLWTASAFSSDSFSLATPDRAIDEQQASRWQSGVPQGSQSPEWFQIDLGQSVRVRRVVLYSATATDQAQALDVVVSSSPLALSATPIASAVSGGSTTTIELDGTGRYLLLKQTGSSTAWWSINDLAVFGCVQ